MSLADLFGRKKTSVSPAKDIADQRVKNIDALKREMTESRAEARTQMNLAERRILEARRDAIDAQRSGNANKKAIACNEIKVNLAVYRYSQGIESAIDVMESNIRMSALTDDLSRIVDRVARLKIPKETVDFGALTKRALKGLRVPDVQGLDTMVQGLLAGSAQNTSLPETDSWIEEFIANPGMTVDQIQAPVLSDPVAPAKTETEAPAEEEMDLKDLMNLLDAMNNGK